MNATVKFGFIIIAMMMIAACSVPRPAAHSTRDGSSFEKAIIVNSIPEEYKFAAAHCQECQFTGQSLVFHKNKPYDVLDFIRPDGQKVSFYFDISRFY